MANTDPPPDGLISSVRAFEIAGDVIDRSVRAAFQSGVKLATENERLRWLAAMREVASNHPKDGPVWIELAAVVRLIDSGESL